MTLAGLVMQAYPSPEWAVFLEVSNSTGFQAKRRADAVAMGVWPSRGHALVGFEFKEDRRDWLREKNDPAKADVIAADCDCWYVVAGAEKIVKLDELPAPWGLYVANEDRSRLKCVKPPVPFADRDKSTIRRRFAAAMLRKVSETTVARVELNRIVDERVKEAVARTTDGRERDGLQRRVEELEKILATFREHAGVDLEDWRGSENISKAVSAVMQGENYLRDLTHARDRLSAAAKEIDGSIKAWPKSIGAGDVSA